MDHLWTPWRMKYIQDSHIHEDCIFCSVAESEDDVNNLVFARGNQAFMILNRYPYTSGHVMCVPFVHVDRLNGLSAETRAEMMEMTNMAIEALQTVYQPEGFNIGMNLGEVAGAGIADHLHIHIVPRWGGDTNFMSSVGETRVLPEALPETYRRVSAAWQALKAG